MYERGAIGEPILWEAKWTRCIVQSKHMRNFCSWLDSWIRRWVRDWMDSIRRGVGEITIVEVGKLK